MHCMYNACMATIQVRDVTDRTLTTLKVRAARAGQSLQGYIRQLLENEVKRLSLPGHQSEPTTPPEYAAPIRPNRFSLAGLTSPQKPPGVSPLQRNSRSGSHHGLGLYPTSDSHTPGQSGASSHRNSDEEEDEEEDSYEAELPLPRRRPAV